MASTEISLSDFFASRRTTHIKTIFGDERYSGFVDGDFYQWRNQFKLDG
jgi:hypothetical protein